MLKWAYPSLKCELILNLADQVCTRRLVNHVKDGAKLLVENRWKEAIFNDRKKKKMLLIHCGVTLE